VRARGQRTPKKKVYGPPYQTSLKGSPKRKWDIRRWESEIVSYPWEQVKATKKKKILPTTNLKEGEEYVQDPQTSE